MWTHQTRQSTSPCMDCFSITTNAGIFPLRYSNLHSTNHIPEQSWINGRKIYPQFCSAFSISLWIKEILCYPKLHRNCFSHFDNLMSRMVKNQGTSEEVNKTYYYLQDFYQLLCFSLFPFKADLLILASP